MTCMVMPDRTRTAIQRTPCGACSAIRAMLGVLRWGGKFTPVQRFMAGNAERQPVIDIKCQVWKFRQWLDVMGVYVSFFAALLTGIVIALKNGLSPFGKIASVLTAATVCGFTTLPRCGFFANKGFSPTGSRAVNRSFVSAIKHLSAIGALSCLRRIPRRPASLRAIVRGVGSVGFDLELYAALLAYLCNLCVFHRFIISHSTQICPAYVAVALQRFLDHTGVRPVLLDSQVS